MRDQCCMQTTDAHESDEQNLSRAQCLWIGCGHSSRVITLAWRDLNAWRDIMPLGKVTHPEILLYTAAVMELFGGFAIQWPRTKRIGAFSLGSIYFIFA